MWITHKTQYFNVRNYPYIEQEKLMTYLCNIVRKCFYGVRLSSRKLEFLPISLRWRRLPCPADLELGQVTWWKRRGGEYQRVWWPARTQPFVLGPQSKLIRTCLQPVGQHSQQTAWIRPLSQELDKRDVHNCDVHIMPGIIIYWVHDAGLLQQ